MSELGQSRRGRAASKPGLIRDAAESGKYEVAAGMCCFRSAPGSAHSLSWPARYSHFLPERASFVPMRAWHLQNDGPPILVRVATSLIFFFERGSALNPQEAPGDTPPGEPAASPRRTSG